MSYQSQTATTFVKLNLTNLGRQKMALGKFSIDQVVFSDREVRYEFNRRYPSKDVGFANMNPTSDRLYSIENNKVLSPAFAAPGLPNKNFDGTKPYQLGGKAVTSTQLLTARTESRGMWSAVTDGSNQSIGKYIIDTNKTLTTGATVGTGLLGVADFTLVSGAANIGSFVHMRYRPPTTLNPSLDSNAPVHSLWYRIILSNSKVFVDRDVPNFNSGTFAQTFSTYPALATTEYWNSGTTAPGEMWSLNIVRTSNVLGTTTVFAQNGSGYTSYGSKGFAGAKRYFGFDKEQRAVGFIWHQDKFTGNTYGDLFIPKTTQLDLPDLMWHRKSGVLPGRSITSGHRFVDAGSGVFYDEISKSNYTELKDGTDTNSITVGRVYFDLKLIVVTDQELLMAMSYKSNRNYTLPKLQVELSESHPENGATPWIQDGYTYYFSYYTREFGEYRDDGSYGYAPSSPCEYWTKVVGQNRLDGSPYYASVSFPPSGFPYLRDETNMESFSGTGWMSNRVQLLVNAFKTTEDGATGVDRVRPNTWTAITQGDIVSNQNGVYTGETGNATIFPQFLGTRVFNIHQGDVNSASNTDWEGNDVSYQIPEKQAMNWSFTGETGVTYGDEIFLNGNVKTTFGLKTEKVIVTVSIGKDELNASQNGGYDGKLDESTYITEIGVLNDQNELVAVGKPTYPIRKNTARHLLFQLEINI